MKTTPRGWKRMLTLVSAVSLSLFGLAEAQAVVGQPLKYVFEQTGFADGATVTGTFTGVDLDGNGILVHFPTGEVPVGNLPPIAFDELADFSLQFSGSTLFPSFEMLLGDLFGFVFEIGSGDLGDDPAFDPTIGGNLTEGIGLTNTSYFYVTGQGPTQTNGGYIGLFGSGAGGDFVNNASDSTTQLMSVTRVPEPATGLLLAGLGIAAACRWRR